MFHFDHGVHAAKKKIKMDQASVPWERKEKELRNNIENIKCAWCHGGDQVEVSENENLTRYVRGHGLLQRYGRE